MIIQKVMPNDFDAIRSFYYDVIDGNRNYPYPLGWTKDIYPSLAQLSNLIGKGELYAGKEDEAIVSAMALNNDFNEGYDRLDWPTKAARDEVFVIHLLAVLPSRTGQGLARQMVEFAIEQAECRGGKAIRLDVLEGNLPACALYESIGFKKLHTLTMFYPDTGYTEFDLFELALDDKSRATSSPAPRHATSHPSSMNAFDFDGTLYAGDSTAHFIFFAIRRKPKTLRAAPRQLWAAIRFGLHAIDKTTFKQNLYSFLPYVDDVEQLIATFWDTHRTKMKDAVVSQAAEGDLIISASPEFLLRPICESYSFRLIASPVDPLRGTCLGPNCHGEQKVKRFNEEYPGVTIDRFYSDSLKDTPMARLARRAYLVKGSEILDFPL